MRWSRSFIPTLREDPKEAESASHRLMLRAGLARQLAAGIYSFLPVGLRVLERLCAIIRDEMNRAGAQELLLPALHPAELWKASGRFEALGEDKFSFENRSGQLYVLGPTHEEVITDLVARSVQSYKDLPLILYQIQSKFRDEKRPRFGVIRAKEFIMKDAYSFHADEKSLEEGYRKMYAAYERVFSRVGVEAIAVEADTGVMGGSASHEFMARVPFGEDIIVSCAACRTSSSREIAARAARETRPLARAKVPACEAFDTPNLKSIEELQKAFKIAPERMIKTLIYLADGKPLAVLVRGDHEVCEAKVRRHLGASKLLLAGKEEIERVTQAPVGFAGPVGLSRVTCVADFDVAAVQDGVTGANQRDKHLRHVLPGRDFDVRETADLRYVLDADACPSCRKPLKLERALEVGHVFKLGTRYSKPFEAYARDEKGERKPILMGCYGIGVTRLLAAVIEQHHDERGIVWPRAVAPFPVEIVTLNESHEPTREAAGKLYEDLRASGLEVLYDDRDERAGVKFNDADLLGAPLRVVLSEKTVSSGCFELKARGEHEARMHSLSEAKTVIADALR